MSNNHVYVLFNEDYILLKNIFIHNIFKKKEIFILSKIYFLFSQNNPKNTFGLKLLVITILQSQM